MAKTIGSNRNTNDTAVTTSVVLNTTTAVTISAADANRVFFDVNNNDSAHSFWLRLYPAAQDNIKQGIYISDKNGCRPFWTMPSGEKYTGEISAISETDTPTAYVTEY